MFRFLNAFLIVFFFAFFTAKAQMNMNTNLTDVDGGTVSLNDVKGEKLTVLDFWATWCKPCMKFIPKLVELHAEFKDKGVQFIGIDEDSPRNISKVKPLAHSIGITYPVLLDTDQALMTDLLVGSLPTLIIFDNTGKVLFTHEGYSHGDEDKIREEIEKLLANLN